MTGALLTLNTGSSSLKFSLFGLEHDLPLLAMGAVSDIGGASHFHGYDATTGKDQTGTLPAHADHEAALIHILNWLDHNSDCHQIVACAHRIVHGGPVYDQATELSGPVLDDLTALIPLAPLHQPCSLAAVATIAREKPDLRQFACFDTAFHAHHAPRTQVFALPADIRDKGVRRYGFHGLSYSWIARRLKADLPHLAAGRVVVAHLGNGASLCAMSDGRSVDTTMGMTTLDGLPMGSRCGALDPGAILYMQQALGMSPADVEDVLYNQSGLKGLSGISNDVKVLLDSRDPQAAFALDVFAFKTAQNIAAMAVSIGGMDGLVFTGGIGEHATSVRDDILSHLAFLPPFETHIIAANEERAMAEEVFKHFFGVS